MAYKHLSDSSLGTETGIVEELPSALVWMSRLAYEHLSHFSHGTETGNVEELLSTLVWMYTLMMVAEPEDVDRWKVTTNDGPWRLLHTPINWACHRTCISSVLCPHLSATLECPLL